LLAVAADGGVLKPVVPSAKPKPKVVLPEPVHAAIVALQDACNDQKGDLCLKSLCFKLALDSVLRFWSKDCADLPHPVPIGKLGADDDDDDALHLALMSTCKLSMTITDSATRTMTHCFEESINDCGSMGNFEANPQLVQCYLAQMMPRYTSIAADAFKALTSRLRDLDFTILDCTIAATTVTGSSHTVLEFDAAKNTPASSPGVATPAPNVSGGAAADAVRGTKRKAESDIVGHQFAANETVDGIEYKVCFLRFNNNTSSKVFLHSNYNGNPLNLKIGYTCTQCGVTATSGQWCSVRTNPLCARCYNYNRDNV
jgi:hypothetical protein